MLSRIDLLSRLARPASSRIVLLVLDGFGDLSNEDQPKTALEVADLPNLDALTQRSALGRLVPVAPGITPGSGPGHLALFGYEPTAPETDIGRGVLEALGLGIGIEPGDIAARANFASVDARGNLTDRRAGRIPTDECRRLCDKLSAVAEADGLDIEVHPGESYRFVLLLRGDDLSPAVADTDPQALGVPRLELRAAGPQAESTVERLRPAIDAMLETLDGEAQANSFLLRGFSELPRLPQFGDAYKLRAGAFAGYPLYRGVAAACGMEVVECGKQIDEILDVVGARWQDFNYFFLHVKQTDMAGEDGDLAAKVETLERVDRSLPRLLDLSPDVLAITGDHSTPVPLKSHSWHPVPLLLSSDVCFVDDSRQFTELEAARGGLGDLRSADLMGLLLANAGRLMKFGA